LRGEKVADFPFIQAKNYTRANRESIRWIVIHSAELPELADGAERLAQWAAGPSAPKASWHYAVDADSIVQSVAEKDIAWHAPGANAEGVGIELVGYARQSDAQWRDDFSLATIVRCARLVADIAARWSIPLVYCDRNALIAKAPGVTTHREVSLAFRKSTHTDPGPHFPMGCLLAAAEEFSR
jgi:N-acetyl-anhydromuramyl-L-alanine amidase AmpD